jgi:aconitate hydratase
MVAKILEGKKVHSGVTLGIAPGSRQVVKMLADEGALSILLAAGARLLENACGFCIGNSMSPGTNGISLRTSNRNFEGRSGTPSAKVYLVSPETAALAAVYGRVVDARTMEELQYPRVRQPKAFEIDDSLFLKPPEDGSKVQIVRGPNIGKVPKNDPLAEKLDGVATIKVGDKITTDHIMPAGQRLKYRSNVEAYARYVFENVDASFSQRALKNKEQGIHNFIIAGDSYGQGSSREHAALCPMFLGVKAVVAKSFERIHLANLINMGIVPLVFQKGADLDKIEQGDRLVVSAIRDIVSTGKGTLRDETKGVDIPVKADLSDRQKEMVLKGGLLNLYAKDDGKK